VTKELIMFARRGAPLEEPPPPARSGEVQDARCEAGAFRVVALIGAVVTAIGAFTIVLARWRYAHPPDHSFIDLPGTFLVTFGTQLGVTALAFGIPLTLGGAALWWRTRSSVAVAVSAPASEVPRAVVVPARRRGPGQGRA
jgi:hypothetical protein